MPERKSKTAVLIDANALLHRAWHALPPLTAPDGKLVNAVYGFTSVLLKVLQNERPDHLVVCWDTAAPTFRHVAEPAYKAQREEQPQEFYDQADPVKEVVEALGGLNVELDGYEADDLLGTLALRLAKGGTEVSVYTSDRDVWQIIGQRIKVVAFKKGVSETLTYNQENFKELTGLEPSQIADYKALRGDASDNLKGVPGIGEKTATELLKKYLYLDTVFRAAHDPKSELADGVRRKLLEGEKAAEATLPLVKLVLDVPVKLKDEDMLRRPADEDRLRELFASLGFKTLLSRIGIRTAKPNVTAVEQTMEKIKRNEDGQERVEAVGHSPATVDEIKDLLEDAKQELELIIDPVVTSQDSLFSDTVEIGLGTKTRTVLVTKSLLGEKKVTDTLKKILEDGEIGKIGHGLKQAWHWCRNHGWDLNGLVFDTEIAAYLLAAGEGGHDLGTLAVTKLGLAVPEDESRPTHEIDAIRKLERLLSVEIKESKLTDVLGKFELPLIPILGKMEEVGIGIDIAYFKKLSDEFQETKRGLEKQMVEMAGEEFNPASPAQLSHVLFDTLKLSTKGIKRGKTGISTAASELDKLDGAHPIVAKVGEYREVAKLLSTYVEALPASADEEGRVHTTYNQDVTSTGRLSSTNPNLQNIPIRTELGRRIRRGFVAKKGMELLSCDYSQIELRIVAALADDERMLKAFREKQDIHTATAAAIWHVSPDSVTKEQRRAAKAVNFGIIYGQGPMGLSRSAGIPIDEARHFIDEYFMVYSGIKEFLEKTKAQARADGYVETFFGRRRLMTEISSNRPEVRAAAERMAINMPVQGTAADIIKSAMIKVDRMLPEISDKSRLLLQVHDELVLEIPEGQGPQIAKQIRDIMESAETIPCPLVVDAKCGTNWDEMIGI